MTEAAIEQIIQRAREKFPGVTPRIISDNGPQFIARDFKEFIRLCGMTPARTSPYYPRATARLNAGIASARRNVSALVRL
jgi:putative transposase